jgi:glycine reductase
MSSGKKLREGRADIMAAVRAVHYLNQFFGQIGGEDKADITPFQKDGPVGPGTALQKAFGDEIEIVGTVICGDTYFNENIETATTEIMELIAGYQPQMLIAGPAFNAGRYGVACGAVCAAAAEKFAIPVITGMYEENPGADLYRKQAYIVRTGDSAAKMRTAIPAMSKLALKIARGEELGTPADEGYLEQGLRFNTMHHTERGSSRAVAMLLKKLKGEPYQSEYPMPSFSRVTPRPAIKDLKNAKIALVTSGGIVPKGNPDRIEASSASHFGRYDITGIEDLTEDTFETAHGGYDPVYANLDADRVLPIDVLRQMEKEGVIGSLHNVYYATVGNGTSVANAQKYAHAIGLELSEENIDGIILTST